MIYLASPYSNRYAHVQQRRYEQVMAFVAEETRRGQLIYSPILHCHPMSVAHALPGDHNFWLQYDRNMIDRADEVIVLMLSGWEESKGVAAEIEYAISIGKKVNMVEFRG